MRKILILGLAVILAGCSGTSPGETVTPGATGSPPVTDEAAESALQAATATAPVESPAPTASLPVTSSLNHRELLDELLFSDSSRPEGKAVLAQMAESGDTRFVAGLIDTLRYRGSLRQEIGETLNTLTGQELAPDWHTWVEWAGQHPEIESFAAYPAWKANLLAQIDPNFRRFVNAEMKIAPGSRVEEIVWGGVRVDGIPALDNPRMVDPAEASYLVPEERVFGVSLNGDSRAYPARFLDWHEMFNDIVGGEPVSLAY
jgi:hypothetical protein